MPMKSRMRPGPAVALAAVVALSVTAVPFAAFAGQPQAHAADRDCADFSSQREAQDYFLSIGGPTSDPDRLDGDSDGQACDLLPCPCGASGTSAPAPTTTPEPRKTAQVIRARITKVTDGDTVKVQAYG